MPASIVVKLRSITDGSLLNSNGLLLHAIWYKTWADGDEKMQALAQKMHEIEDSKKPFTISPLMNLKSDARGICHFKIGQESWFRITSLSDELTDNLSSWINKIKRTCIEMEKTIWYIEDIYQFQDEHPWAGQMSYASIMQLVEMKLRNATWTLEFATPMTLNGSKFVFPFPQPDSLARSWTRKWLTFSPDAVKTSPDEMFQEIRENISIAHYQLKTETVRIRGVSLPGCLGTITYKDHGLPPEMRQALNVLMHFSFFCGSGYKTTQGLGQTRLINTH